MAEGKFVTYYRVSTERQGRSGLGLEAQKKAVLDYLNGNGWDIVESFTEVESGKRNDRPELLRALATCRLHGATLVIAKLDRLARNVAFISNLMDSDVEFVAVDMPQANKLTVHIMAAMAEHEREMISQRTKVALAAAKARGVILGRAGEDNLTLEGIARGTKKSAEVRRESARRWGEDVMPVINSIMGAGVTSLNGVALMLNHKQIPTRRGGQWSATQVKRVMELAA